MDSANGLDKKLQELIKTVQRKDTQKDIEKIQEDIDKDQEWLDKNEKYYQDIKDAFENGQKDPYSGETKKYEEQNGVIKSRYGFTIEEYELKEGRLFEEEGEVNADRN